MGEYRKYKVGLEKVVPQKVAPNIQENFNVLYKFGPNFGLLFEDFLFIDSYFYAIALSNLRGWVTRNLG